MQESSKSRVTASKINLNPRDDIKKLILPRINQSASFRPINLLRTRPNNISNEFFQFSQSISRCDFKTPVSNSTPISKMSNFRLKSSQLLFNVFLILLHHSFKVSSIRKDIGFQEMRLCRNTVQGRYLISDDNGNVCDGLSVNPQTRCCPDKGEKFSCQGCNLLSQCCNAYEFCVSCCLHPSRTLEEDVRTLKIAKPATAGTYASVFDFCAGRCRHNSESVVHENAYLSDFHHCFSLPANSSGGNYAQLEARLVGINVVIGSQGESCDSVCKSNGQSCVINKLPVLNQCDIMKKYMPCKGECLASIGADQPAEVVNDAPRYLNPGACLFTRTQSMLSCDGSHPHTRRLCPCA